MKKSSPKISCQGVWQLFGKDPAQFLQSHNGTPSLAEIQQAGFIGAVRDVSFEVREQEILMLMGLSGSGKSTMIRCITQLLKPTAGSVYFNGVDLTQVSAAELTELRRHKMGMVFQHFGLLPHRTVLENIAFPLEVQKVPRDQRIARARELVEVVGLAGRENYFPRELSGGQQQRVGIARSLSVEPDVWFLDEPFSALDPLIRREMQDEFMRLQTMLCKSIVFVTHDFEEAVRLGDRIAIMNEGALVQIGTPEELVTEPANAYVEKFVKDAPRAKLISVRRVMGAQINSGETAGQCAAGDKLEVVAAKLLCADKPMQVTDGGEVVGALTREQLVRALYPEHAA